MPRLYFFQTWKQGLPNSKLTLLWKMTRRLFMLFYLKHAGFLRTCKKHIKIPCRRLPSDTCWQRHCTSCGTKLQPQGVSKAPRFVVKWMKQTNRGHLSTIRQNVLVVVGENLDPFQQASLNLNLLRINLGRTGKLQEMITTDCWSWKSLQHLLAKL